MLPCHTFLCDTEFNVFCCFFVSVFVPFAFLVFFLFHGFRDPLTRIDEDLDDICVFYGCWIGLIGLIG